MPGPSPSNATTGALTLAPGAPFPTGNTPRNLTFDHASKFAYVSCEGTGISGYSINQTNGSLTTVPGSPFALSKHNSLAAGITVDGSGKYVYVEGQSGVDGYKINQLTGALKLLAGSPFANGAGGGSMATDPLGKFVYGVSSVGTTAYTVNSSSGALAQLATAPIGGEIVPDPTGNYLYAPDVVQVDRNTGVVTPLMEPGNNNAIGPLAVSTGTAQVQYVPKFAYVANSADNTVSRIQRGRRQRTAHSCGNFQNWHKSVVPGNRLKRQVFIRNKHRLKHTFCFQNQFAHWHTHSRQRSLYATHVGPGAVAVSPSGSAVYVANTSAETVTNSPSIHPQDSSPAWAQHGTEVSAATPTRWPSTPWAPTYTLLVVARP